MLHLIIPSKKQKTKRQGANKMKINKMVHTDLVKAIKKSKASGDISSKYYKTLLNALAIKGLRPKETK